MPTMESQILTLDSADWHIPDRNDAWISALEAGKVLYFPQLAFTPKDDERRFFTPAIRNPKTRNISLGIDGQLKGAVGDLTTQLSLAAMIDRFRLQAQTLIDSLLPRYTTALRLAPTSYRPTQVETRVQSWRANDRLIHVDAFPSRPNRGERILRVFANVHPENMPRVWRVGEPFEAVAHRFLPHAKKYSRPKAKALRALRVTKSLRSEYDHLMLQLHDQMKSDHTYQASTAHATVPFAASSVWVCFSDQVSHAVLSGQYMMEQTFHVPVERQYDPNTSPLAILTRLSGRTLI